MLEYVNIYADTSGWILTRCAKEIKKRYPAISINGNPRPINYSINYALYKNVPGIKIGMFTHLEDTGTFHKRFKETALLYDHCVSMCKNTTRILNDIGVPPEKITEIYLGYDERVKKDPVFGVVGRVYPSGRKGEQLVRNMVQGGRKVLAWGKGWPIPDNNIFTEWDDLPNFYKSIDYLVVTSLNEGGPMPVLDAIAAGVPVIAPDTGWCWEFPVIKYDKGSWNSLNAVLQKLSNPPSWEGWSVQHEKMFRQIAIKEGLI